MLCLDPSSASRGGKAGGTTKRGRGPVLLDELIQILCDHAAGNYRALCTMAGDLLDTAAQQERTQLDEKLYFECFQAPTVVNRKRKNT